IAEDDGAVPERDLHRRQFPSGARLFDILGTTGEQVGPQSRVLGTDYLPRRGVDQRVTTITDDAALGDVGFDNLLSQKRLDRKPPQGGHCANGLAHGPSSCTTRPIDRTPLAAFGQSRSDVATDGRRRKLLSNYVWTAGRKSHADPRRTMRYQRPGNPLD